MTKQDSIDLSLPQSVTVREVIITGVFKRPRLTTLKPWAVMQLKDDRSNESACVAFLTAAETKPAGVKEQKSGELAHHWLPAGDIRIHYFL